MDRDSVRFVDTERLRVAYREAGPPDRPTVVLVHGNVSSSVFWLPVMEALAPRWHLLAPDLRGFGDTEALAIDATRGVAEWADDLAAFRAALHLEAPLHWVGWSLGGGVVMQTAITRPELVASLALIAPLSPFGFGGTVDAAGRWAFDDAAGSGAGTVNAQFVARLAAGEREAADEVSPRAVMNTMYFRPPFRMAAALEDRLVGGMLSTRVGPGFYPGSSEASPNWPGQAPGKDGIANAMAPRWVNLAGLAEMPVPIPVLWVRGSEDRIVSDGSWMDLATLGQLGTVPGWPGPEVMPPQPMVTQTRRVLERFAARGGRYREVVVEETGHAPHLERPDVVLPHLEALWNGVRVQP